MQQEKELVDVVLLRNAFRFFWYPGVVRYARVGVTRTNGVLKAVFVRRGESYGKEVLLTKAGLGSALLASLGNVIVILLSLFASYKWYSPPLKWAVPVVCGAFILSTSPAVRGVLRLVFVLVGSIVSLLPVKCILSGNSMVLPQLVPAWLGAFAAGCMFHVLSAAFRGNLYSVLPGFCVVFVAFKTEPAAAGGKVG